MTYVGRPSLAVEHICLYLRLRPLGPYQRNSLRRSPEPARVTFVLTFNRSETSKQERAKLWLLNKGYVLVDGNGQELFCRSYSHMFQELVCCATKLPNFAAELSWTLLVLFNPLQSYQPPLTMKSTARRHSIGSTSSGSSGSSTTAPAIRSRPL